jgi:mRNA interferase MazF
VVVLTRDSVIPFLHSLMVAPVSSAPRGIDSEVLVGIEEGLKRASAVNLDNVQTVRKDRLKKHLGRLDRAKMIEVCEALDLATGCDAPGR